MMVVSRRRMRQAGTTPDFDAIDTLRKPHVVNVALEAVMRVERGLIRRGFAFPGGGSLLMVARKPIGPEALP
jgi:hypothetical protein